MTGSGSPARPRVSVVVAVIGNTAALLTVPRVGSGRT
jgi:hypothetical protein